MNRMKTNQFFLTLAALCITLSVSKANELDSFVTVNELLAAYQPVHTALVVDDLVKAQEGSKVLQALLAKWLLENPNSSQKADVQKFEKSATTLLTSEDLDDARKAFIPLSQGAIALIRADKTLESKWQLFYCPMVAKNQGYWVQPKGQELLNPYMGSSMPNCGSKKPW